MAANILYFKKLGTINCAPTRELKDATKKMAVILNDAYRELRPQGKPVNSAPILGEEPGISLCCYRKKDCGADNENVQDFNYINNNSYPCWSSHGL
ncbi:MAG TPA: hypothetical protein DEO84_03875 [candidate division Zixibacteria bacterium]|nr:hypothetical protein [candidate division Zixibacteria bacterium]